MPPFKSGLKRKVDSSRPAAVNKSEPRFPDDGEELFRGGLGAEEDTTDSEHEDEEARGSECEQNEVLFDSSIDCSLDEEDSEIESDDSTELEDSEDDENDNSDGEKDSESDGNGDSGTESAASAKSHISKTSENIQKQKQTKAGKLIKDGPKSESSVDILTDKIKETTVTLQPVEQKDEYSSGDTSDEEERVNTAGDVPAWWYAEYPHVGYDSDGRRLLRPAQRDAVDEFLRQCEDPEFWRTVRDPATGQDVRLSAADLQLIHRLRQGLLPGPHPYQPWSEWFSREVLPTPLRAFPDHKRSFLPSRSDRLQVARIVHALKMGWTKTRKQMAEERKKKKEKQFYNLWGSEGAEGAEAARRGPRPLPAPRRALPSHAESYNPPPEYLLDDKERAEWDALSETPWRRKYRVLPQAHGSLRRVPAYERFARERFLRCLDLYLAPRALKMRLTVGPEALVPRLPAPRALQPFPTHEALCVRAHARTLVRAADFHPSGQYFASGGADGFVKVWETSTGRCLWSMRVAEGGETESEEAEGGVCAVQWAGAGRAPLLSAAAGRALLLLAPALEPRPHPLDALLGEPAHPAHPHTTGGRAESCAQWQEVEAARWALGERARVRHWRAVRHVSWHARGDYACAALAGPGAGARAIAVHQVSRRATHAPLARNIGDVQCAAFHPAKPLLFVATQRAVRVYDLVKQQLVRKLQPGAQWISCMALHPRGDNLLVGSYDRKCMWFDLELSARPYQTLRLHARAVRSVAFHKRYPLFASAGDDPRLLVSHGMVYNDLLQNPLLVPLKQLAGGERVGELCVLQLCWHPAQPWLLAACADGTLRLYS